MNKDKKKSVVTEMSNRKNFNKKLLRQQNLFELEYQIANALEKQDMTQMELARRLDVDRSVISKDMSGALKKAGMQKLNEIAEALDCKFIPLFIANEDMEEFKSVIGHFLKLPRD
jgi:predicted XRE-type DNA-binding protein